MSNRILRTQTFRARTVMVGCAAAALLLTFVATAGAEPGNDNRAPELPGDTARLRVVAGNKVAAHAYAIGVQI
jgi:hypothetical protein